MTLKTSLIALGILTASAFAVAPASAGSAGLVIEFGGAHGPAIAVTGKERYNSFQRFDGRRHDARVPVHRVERKLSRHGFDNVRFLDDRGDAYVFRARGYRNQTVRVVVSAYTADIIRVVQMDRDRRDRRDGGGWNRKNRHGW